MTKSSKLNTLFKPCNNASCPAIYRDESGKVFIQGNRLGVGGRNQISIAGHEEVVELSPELLDFLRSYQS